MNLYDPDNKHFGEVVEIAAFTIARDNSVWVSGKFASGLVFTCRQSSLTFA